MIKLLNKLNKKKKKKISDSFIGSSLILTKQIAQILSKSFSLTYNL